MQSSARFTGSETWMKNKRSMHVTRKLITRKYIMEAKKKVSLIKLFFSELDASTIGHFMTTQNTLPQNIISFFNHSM